MGYIFTFLGGFVVGAGGLIWAIANGSAVWEIFDKVKRIFKK